MNGPHAVIIRADQQVARNESAIRDAERIYGAPIRSAIASRYNDVIMLLRILGLRCAACAAYVSGYRFVAQGYTPSVTCRDCSRLHS